MNGLDIFDTRTCRILNKAIVEALTDLSKKYNLEISTDGGKYDDLQYTVRLKITLINEQGESGDKLTWDKWAPIHGFTKEDFGKTFVIRGRIFKITGWAPRRTKRPVCAQDVGTLKRFVFEYNQVQFLLRTQQGDLSAKEQEVL